MGTFINVILLRAIHKFKAKQAIMSRTGNTGPPESEMERSLRYKNLDLLIILTITDKKFKFQDHHLN